MKLKVLSLILWGSVFVNYYVCAQNYGPELLLHNDFGTISTEGVNTTPLYVLPSWAVLDSVYTQPPTRVYYNNHTKGSTDPAPENTSVNPHVTVAPPLATSGQTYYAFGFDEGWYSNYYTFLSKDGSNSNEQVRMAPNNGRYAIATSSGGMYSPPTLSVGNTPWYTVYDKFETNMANPTNYFLIVNADTDNKKVFYKQKVGVTPGHIYRMSADISRMNAGATPPNVAFIIIPATNDNEADSLSLRTATPQLNTGDIPDDGGVWHTFTFDYTAPCGADSVWVAFANNVVGGNGNDLGLDNLSLKELRPLIVTSTIGDCNNLSYELTGTVPGASGLFIYEWHGNTGPGGADEVLAATSTYSTGRLGTYYIKIWTSETVGCPIISPAVTLTPGTAGGDCASAIDLPCANDDVVPDTVAALPVYYDIVKNDCNLPTACNFGDPTVPECSQENLQVLTFTIPAMYSPNNTAVTYPAGSSVMLSDNEGNTIGVLKIDTLGMLTFQVVPDYTGPYTSINFPYTIINTQNGGTATANVSILRKTIEYEAYASCPFQPVTIVFDFPTFSPQDYTDRRTGNPIPLTPTDSVAYRFYLVNTNTNEVVCDTTSQTSYSIHRNDPNDPSQGGTLTISFFYDMQSGLINFNLQKKEPYLQPNRDVDNILRVLTVEVAPNRATWSGSAAGSSAWNHSDNWVAGGLGGYPTWCTDVVISGDSQIVNFPVINKGADVCRDIVFESGASVGKVQDLIYRAAYVQYQPPGFSKWTMISVPLKYIYSADFNPDRTWNINSAYSDIKSYMSHFDLAYSQNNKPNPDGVTGTSFGSFSKPFAYLSDTLKAGLGIASNVILTGNGGTTFTRDSTFYFPRYVPYGNAKAMESIGTLLRETRYYYHYSDNGEWATDLPYVTMPRGSVPAKTTDAAWQTYYQNEHGPVWPNPLVMQDSRFRFIYEDSKYGYSNGAFTIPVEGTGGTRMVGNPLMSHVDFDIFSTLNSGAIQPYYRVWDGTSFYVYIAPSFGGSYNNEVWLGMDNLSTSPDDVVEGSLRYIPPMQSFFVDVVNPGDPLSLNFNTSVSTAMCTATDDRYQLRSSQTVNENLLKLRLNMNGVETVALLASLPKASDRYDSKEDIYKLFSYDQSTPEIYIVSDNTAIEINAVSQEGEEKLIPLGIKTNQTGSFELHIEGVSDFNAYEQVQLRDVLSGNSYDLREKASFTFEKTSPENIEGRFYIALSGSFTGLESIDPDDPDNSGITIVHEDNSVRIYSPVNEIESVEAYDISGRLFFRETEMGTSSYLWNPGALQGMYVLKVCAGKHVKVHKIKL